MMKPGFAKRCLILAAALFTLPTLSSASNNMGADLTYDYLGNGQYRIELKSYSHDAAAPQSVVVSLFSASCGVTQELTLQQGGLAGVSLDCKTKPGAKAGGVTEFTYSGTVSLQQCTDWVFSYREPGGGQNGLMNLADPASQLYVEATLNNVLAPENSSPKFTIAPTPYFPMGLPFTFNQGAVDKNGNTLVYSLVEAMSDANTPVAYQPGFNASLPLSTYNGAFDFSPYTGAFTVKADAPQTALVALLVQEFDANGHMIGSVTRHVTLNVTNMGQNNLPGIAPVGNYAGGVYNRAKNTFSVRNGETLSFSFVVSDGDAGQTLTITSNASQTTPGAVVDISGKGTRTVNYSWTAPQSGAGFYNVAFQISDNATPVGFQTVSYNIYVSDAIDAAAGDQFIEPAALRPLAEAATQIPGSAAGGTFEKAPALANDPVAKPNAVAGGDYVDVTPQNPQLCAGQGQSVQLNAVLYVNGVPIPSCSGTYTTQLIPFNPTAGAGTQVQLGDDQVSGALPIGFNFKFYCNDYTDFYLGSNGFITFSPNQPSGCCSGQFLPNAAAPNNLVAAAWDDLYPPGAGSVTYFTSGVAPNRILIVNWTDVPYCCGNLPQVTTQIKLFEGTNIIEIHSASIQNISPGTQGIEDLNGANAAVVPGRNAAAWNANNDAYRFTPGSTVTFAWSPVTGLSDPTSGTPVASPLVTTTYNVTATQGGVTATGTVTVFLVPPVYGGFDIPDALCYNEPPLVLDNYLLPGATPGGVWTGDGVVGGIFDPALAGNGLHIITYTVGIAPCIDIVNDTIGIYDPSVTIETDPAAPPYCGQVVLTAISGGGVGPFNGDAYYLRSQNAFGEPWGSQSNIQAMDAEFGPGNWVSDYFEAINANIVFSQSTDLVWMEGSDGHANALNTFLSANIALIEGWVATGGRLFINAAPNQGGNIQCGFGGVSLTYPSYSPNVAAVFPLHPIYLGPFLPTANNYTGNYYGHATVAGPGITTIMTGVSSLPMVSLKPWSNGIVVFGGMTTTNWHTPQIESQNFRQNILDWMKNYNNAPPFGYLWNNGETTDAITVTQSGTYTVTVTAAQNCTATATITVTVFPDVNIQFITDSVFCVGGILGVQGLDGTSPYTYQWNNGETGDQIIVFVSDDYTAVVTDLNGCQDSVTIDVTVGQPVIAAILTDPALPACGEVMLIADGTGGGGNLCNGDKYYIRSQNAFGEPWGHQSNPQAMDANFGAGNWISEYYETVNVGNLFTNGTCFIMMEGSDGHANAMNSFVTANINAMENWVDNGGRMFMNAAPNQGGVMNWGFGGVTGNYVPGLTWIPNVAAVLPLHPVFSGPFQPTTGNMSGNYYAHATVPGGGAVQILTDAGNAVGPVLTMLDWGGGRVAFGGITTSPWHNPSLESQNLRQNVIDYLVNTPTASCTYLWNTGATTQEILADTPGLYEVTITCTGGCFDSASLQLAIFPGVDIALTSDTVFCVGGIIGVQGSGGLPPYTYLWANGETGDQIIVFVSDDYCVTVTDMNGCTDSLCIDVTVGQPVIATILTDPALPACGEVMLIADGTGGGGNLCNGDKYYIRSQNAFGEPWGHQSNPQAMDANFGAGNWISEYYETVNVANLFTNNTCFIMMEGSDGHANAMNSFVSANLNAIENFVDNGGRLFMNAAPNQGGVMNWGFGGVTCNYVPGLTWIPNVAAVLPLHPVFAGPFQPTTGNMSGNYYAHATVPGGGAVQILTDAGNAVGPVLTILDWGGGRVAFGGITTSPWHNPSLESQNLRQNVIDYLVNTPTASCTYLWNTGATTQEILADTPGLYEVTITCTGGCTDSASIQLAIFPGVDIAVTTDTVFCVGGIIGVLGSGGLPPFTYQWANGETGEQIIVFVSDDYCVTVTDQNGCQDSICIDVTVGQPVVAAINTDPANPPFCGEVTLIADGTGGGGNACNGDKYYIRSQNAFGEPWGHQSNSQAMDAVFGAGNWISEYYETVNVGNLLSNGTCLIFMEGSDGHALAMNTFVTANLGNIENWVDNGGRLFMNAAPNQGGIMNWGFGGVTCNYVPGVTWIPNVGAPAGPLHPVFAGSFQPTTPNMSGNYYAHATVPGGGAIPILQDAGGAIGPVISMLDWGGGRVAFGGITTSPWHNPALESQNLRQDIIEYLYLTPTANCTYLWNTGETTQTITATVDGQYCVTITCTGGCTDSTCINVSLLPAPEGTITGGPNFCVGGVLCDSVVGGVPPYTYAWNNGEVTDCIIVFTSDTYIVTVTGANGCTDIDTVNTIISQPFTATIVTNPAVGPFCGNVDLNAITDGFNQGGTGYYLRSQNAFGEPWGSQSNVNAMDAVFGPGNWVSEYFESVNVGACFAANIAVVFMEGSDGHASAMNNFVTANQTVIENYVAGGGRIFMNAAPNQGGVMNWGFGGVQCNYVPGLTWIPNVTAALPNHQIFVGPFVPTATNFSGNYYAHATVVGPGLTDIVVDVNGVGAVTSELSWGNGIAVFGGITTANWHTPSPESQNVRQNILDYLLNAAGTFTYQWDNGDSTQVSNVDTSGTYCVTVTNVGGCTASACITVVIEPSPLITITGGPEFCGPGQLTAAITGGTQPYTYTWDTGENLFTIDVDSSATYCFYAGDALGVCFDTLCVDVIIHDIPVLTLTMDPPNGVSCDSVAIDAEVVGGGAQGGGDRYYLRTSFAFGEPWGQPNNIQAMDATFGAGLWISDFYETVNVGALFSQATGFIFMEGSDGHAIEMNGFIQANATAMENWVDNGGHLFINAAPNEGGNIDCHFGGITINYPSYSPNSNALAPLHPIYIGPFTPVALNYTGNYFGHGTVSGAGLTDLMAGVGGLSVLSSKPWGLGQVFFGGMTTPNFHTPLPDAQNFRQNILDYVATYVTFTYTYLWNNGDTTQDIVATQTGTYCVTVTAGNGCTSSSCVDVVIGAGLAITPVVICDLAGTTFTVEVTIGGGDGTYVVDGVPIVGNVFVSGVFNAGDPYQFIISDGGPCPSDTISGVGICNQSQPCEPTGCLGPNLVQDPGFENFAPGAFFTSDYDYTPCPGLCVNGLGAPILCSYDYTVSNDPDACNPDWIDVIPDHTTGTGNMMVVDFPTGDVGVGNNEIWCQTITVDSAINYCFGGWFLNPILPGTGLSEPALEFTVNGNSIGNTPLITEDGQWHHHGISFNSGGLTSVTLCINNANFGQLGFDLVMDDIALYDLTPQLPPTAADDAVTFCENGGGNPQVLDVVGNDQDGSFPIDLTTFVILVGPNAADGIATADTATGEITFTPAVGFAGTVTITYQICDANGCCDSAIVDFTQNPNPIFTMTSTPSDCGVNTGTATVVETFAGYLWDNGQTTQTATGLPIGQACVTVTDANSCTATACVTVLSPNGLSLLAVASDSTICLGGSTTLTAQVTGGIAPMTYIWSDGSITASITVSPLVTTTYTVTVTDDQACSTTGTVTITVSEVLLTVAQTAATCNGVCDGTMTVTATGGEAPYTFNLYDANGALVATNQTGLFTGLCSGDYSVSVEDSGGGAANAVNLVNETFDNNPAWNFAASGANSGTPNEWEVNDSEGGVAPTGCGVGFNGDATLHIHCTSPICGILQVTGAAYDAIGEISNQRAASPAISTLGTTGLTLSFDFISNGDGLTDNASLHYSIDGGNTWVVLDPSLKSNVCVGGQGEWEAYSMSLPAACENVADLRIAFNWTNNADNVGTDPSIAVNNLILGAAGGATPGCMASATATIAQPTALTVTTSTTPANCGGAGTATVTVDAGAGTAPYAYLWSTGETTTTIGNLGLGDVFVTVTDANNCSVAATVTVTGGPAVAFTGVVVNTTCGLPNGTITLTTTSGVAPFSYAWTPAQPNAPAITGLASGNYDVVVTDANGCTASATFNVAASVPMTLSLTVSGTTCGVDNGVITVVPNNGNIPFVAVWNPNVSNTLVATGLTAGTYDVSVTDLYGCVATGTGVIQPSQPAAITGVPTAPECIGGNDGDIVTDVTPVGPVYTYTWTGGATGANPSGLAAGTYDVVVSDANNCTASATFVVPDGLIVDVNAGPDVTIAAGDTAMLVAISQPAGIVTWADDQGGTYTGDTIWVTPLVTTTYTATLAVGNCTDADDVIIIISYNNDFAVPNAFSPNGDGINDAFMPIVADDQSMIIVEFRVWNRWGQEVYTGSGPNAAWDGSFKDQPQSRDMYIWGIKFQRPDGVETQRTGEVMLIR